MRPLHHPHVRAGAIAFSVLALMALGARHLPQETIGALAVASSVAPGLTIYAAVVAIVLKGDGR